MPPDQADCQTGQCHRSPATRVEIQEPEACGAFYAEAVRSSGGGRHALQWESHPPDRVVHHTVRQEIVEGVAHGQGVGQYVHAQQPALQPEAVPPDRAGHQIVRQAVVGGVARGQGGEKQDVEGQRPALQRESLPPDRVDHQAVRQAIVEGVAHGQGVEQHVYAQQPALQRETVPPDRAGRQTGQCHQSPAAREEIQEPEACGAFHAEAGRSSVVGRHAL